MSQVPGGGGAAAGGPMALAGGSSGATGAHAVLEARGLKRVYGDRVVLDVDRFDVAAGEITAVMGPSGSGKTTLLRLLATLEVPSEGEVRFGGQVWAARAPAAEARGGRAALDGRTAPGGRANLPRRGGLADLVSWRRHVSFVSQNPVLFSGTVRQNVALALELRAMRDLDRRVDEVLEEVGLSALAGADATSLSAGETERVALARCLAARPQVLLLDEPTANLDPANVAIVEEALARAVRTWGPAVVLVTHNLFQARRVAARTTLLVAGRIVESGETRKLFENPSDPRTAAFVKGDMVF